MLSQNNHQIYTIYDDVTFSVLRTIITQKQNSTGDCFELFKQTL